jgi:hypothetical protein
VSTFFNTVVLIIIGIRGVRIGIVNSPVIVLFCITTGCTLLFLECFLGCSGEKERGKIVSRVAV